MRGRKHLVRRSVDRRPATKCNEFIPWRVFQTTAYFGKAVLLARFTRVEYTANIIASEVAGGNAMGLAPGRTFRPSACKKRLG